MTIKPKKTTAKTPDPRIEKYRIVVRADQLALNHNFVLGAGDYRFYLEGVYIEAAPHGATLVATDGQRMGVFRCDGGIVATPAIVKLPKSVHAIASKHVRAQTIGTKAEPTKELFPWIAIAADEPEFGTVLAAIVDAPDATIAMQALDGGFRSARWFGAVEIIEGAYPEWRRVVPTDFAATEKGPPAFQNKFVTAFKKISRVIRLHPGSDETAALIETDRDDFFGVLMPMRSETRMVKNGKSATPDWAGIVGKEKS